MDVDEALQIVCKFFTPWSSVRGENVRLTKLTGGMMNTVQLLQCKERLDDSCPREIIIRTSGGGLLHDSSIDERRNSPVEENLVFFQASNLGIGPRLYGVYDGGRLEEFISGHLLRPDECNDKCILSQIANVYAIYHSMNIPLSNDKFMLCYYNHVVDLFSNWMSYRHTDWSVKGKRKEDEETWHLINNFDYLRELSCLTSLLTVIESKEVLLHADANYTNFIVRDDEDINDDRSRIIIIDYEWSMKGPRSLDLGAFFCNRLFDWPRGGVSTGFEILPREERKHFLSEYYAKSQQLNFDAKDTLDKVLEEADLGILFYLILFSGLVLKFATFDSKFSSTPPLFFTNYLKYKGQFVLKYPKWLKYLPE